MQTAKLLIASSRDSNIRYATGLNIPDPFIWADLGDNQYILVSKLEYGRAKKEARAGVKVILWDKVDLKNIKKPTGRKKVLGDIAASFLLSYNITNITVPDNFWAGSLEVLREHGLRVSIERPFFPKRLVKTQEEIAAIKKTGLVAKKAFRHALEIIRASTIEWNDTLLYNKQKVTSEFLRNEIESVFLENGCASGETIVSSGEQSAQPHNKGSGPLYAGQPIILDIFPRDLETGYYFDMTRTIIKGTPSKELKRLFDAVKKAQQEALSVVAPGKTKHVHITAAEVFERQGYKTTEEEGFIHSTGHGLGLDIHEPPSLSEKSDETLQEGNVITVEPGLYYKDIGGVRIEDTILVTKEGHINLTNLPKVLIIK